MLHFRPETYLPLAFVAAGAIGFLLTFWRWGAWDMGVSMSRRTTRGPTIVNTPNKDLHSGWRGRAGCGLDKRRPASGYGPDPSGQGRLRYPVVHAG